MKRSAYVSGSGRQSCEPEFNYIGCEAERQKLEKPRFARFFYFVVFRSHSLLDFLESRVMKRKSINHCEERSEMERCKILQSAKDLGVGIANCIGI